MKTSSITVEPRTIRVSGSDTLLEQLEELELGTINLAELLEDTVLTFPVVLPEGVNNETGITEVKVDVQFPELVTRTFNVTEIHAENVPEGMEVDMITQALEVKIRGPKALVRAMKETDKEIPGQAGVEMITVKIRRRCLVLREKGDNYLD